jgi:glutamyl-tRNA reductase
MDEITAEARANSERRRADSIQARQLVDEALVGLRRRLAQRAVSPVIAGLNQRYRETALASVDRLLRNDLAGVQEEKQEGIRRWAETLARHLAHVPMVGLQALAGQSELEAIRTFLTASDDPEISRLADLSPVTTEAHGDLGDEEIL